MYPTRIIYVIDDFTSAWRKNAYKDESKITILGLVYYTQEPEPDYFEAAIRTVMMIHRAEDPGDILLFLTGEQEIEESCQKIEREAADCFDLDPGSVGPLECIPLYASLSPERQRKIYGPAPLLRTPDGPPGRKVIVATNIAETSLTIDGVVYVVDPGFSKQMVYNARIRVESHLVSPISKASAQQRAGRAGRTKPGKCFRLYTEKDFVSELEEQTPPEIIRSNLSSTVLHLVTLGIKDLVRFDYLDAPAPETLMRALELLNYLSALDDDGNLTKLGRMMAEFPLEPQKKEADAARELLTVPNSDHLTLLNVYGRYRAHLSDKSWAWTHYLSAYALSQADNARSQLERIMERLELDVITMDMSDQKKVYRNIGRVLSCAFFMQVAHKEGAQGSYVTMKDNQVVALHPSFGFHKQPDWVIFHDFVLTIRPYIQIITEVQPKWLLKYAPIYFDLDNFPDGETRRALQRIVGREDETSGISRMLRAMNFS
ncbi:P-loop containing nucleoside triphosphate hydrolase protein [Mycena galericulata]|nr:P-loop containing nucleoside triphosphate hydrolase protein [Mycena galericulata]